MKIIECPRDAMQGISEFIPTRMKIDYLNCLLQVGFDTIDFGSFVSPKAIPQMRDTKAVLEGLNLELKKSKLLAIVANVRGAKEACEFSSIHYLGFPLSISETFQLRNTNKSIAVALEEIAKIQDLCFKSKKKLVVYLSMGFGNPYGDPYEMDYINEFVTKLDRLEVKIISLADTIGVAEPKSISALFGSIVPQFPHIEFGAHLHTSPQTSQEKVQAAYLAGCRRMDGALRGFGGCPMVKSEPIGNMATEQMINQLSELGAQIDLDSVALANCLEKSELIF
ncbi:MAG: hydroxymethylglutaryl-CoA lyase [Bacteroidota bacterium]